MLTEQNAAAEKAAAEAAAAEEEAKRAALEEKERAKKESDSIVRGILGTIGKKTMSKLTNKIAGAVVGAALSKVKIPGLSFSLNRAVGISGLKSKVAHATGIPTTKKGLERKIGGEVLKACGKVVDNMIDEK